MSVRIEIRREDQIVDVLPIGDQPLLFGRHGDCDYPLKDSLVSGQHRKVWREKRVVYAEDLDSRNGTKKNGRRIQSGIRFRMRNSEVAQIGATTLKVINPLDTEVTDLVDSEIENFELSRTQLLVVKALARPFRAEPDNPAVPAPTRRDVADHAHVVEKTVTRTYDELEVLLKLGKHNKKDRPVLLASKILEYGLDLRDP